MSIATVKDLINLWPSRATLADDVNQLAQGADRRISTDQVHKWAASNSIPSRYHALLIEAGWSRGFPISAELVVRLHSIVTPRRDGPASLKNAS